MVFILISICQWNTFKWRRTLLLLRRQFFTRVSILVWNTIFLARNEHHFLLLNLWYNPLKPFINSQFIFEFSQNLSSVSCNTGPELWLSTWPEGVAQNLLLDPGFLESWYDIPGKGAFKETNKRTKSNKLNYLAQNFEMDIHFLYV